MRSGYKPHQLQRHAMRHAAAHSVLTRARASSVLDLGCGDGQFIERLASDPQFTQLTGVDESADSIAIAKGHIDPLVQARPELSVSFCVGSMLSLAAELPPHDAVAMIEVIEHFRLDDLPELEDLIFGRLAPEVAVFTTPAAVPVPGLDVYTRKQRRPDHHFEWTPDEAAVWTEHIAEQYGYIPEHTVLSTKPLPGLDLQIIGFMQQA